MQRTIYWNLCRSRGKKREKRTREAISGTSISRYWPTEDRQVGGYIDNCAHLACEWPIACLVSNLVRWQTDVKMWMFFSAMDFFAPGPFTADEVFRYFKSINILTVSMCDAVSMICVMSECLFMHLLSTEPHPDLRRPNRAYNDGPLRFKMHVRALNTWLWLVWCCRSRRKRLFYLFRRRNRFLIFGFLSFLCVSVIVAIDWFLLSRCI